MADALLFLIIALGSCASCSILSPSGSKRIGADQMHQAKESEIPSSMRRSGEEKQRVDLFPFLQFRYEAVGERLASSCIDAQVMGLIYNDQVPRICIE